MSKLLMYRQLNITKLQLLSDLIIQSSLANLYFILKSYHRHVSNTIYLFFIYNKYLKWVHVHRQNSNTIYMLKNTIELGKSIFLKAKRQPLAGLVQKYQKYSYKILTQTTMYCILFYHCKNKI